MDLTKFSELKQIISRLGADPVEVELEKALNGEGIDLDHPERVAACETGLYYIDPRGIVSRALLYIVDKNIGWHKGDKGREAKKLVASKDFNNPTLVKMCHKYHILNCSTLEQAQIHNWKDKYKAAKRLDGTFFYRFLDHQVVLEEVKEQGLEVSGNCLRLLNGLTKGKFIKHDFTSGAFFDFDLSGINS